MKPGRSRSGSTSHVPRPRAAALFPPIMRYAEKAPPYAIAFLSVVLAAVLKWVIDPAADRHYSPFLFFTTAVTITACVGGLLPGLLALILAALVSAYFSAPSRFCSD